MTMLKSTAALALAASAIIAQPAHAQTLTPEEAKAIATDAYVYGYSLITTEVTRVQMSNVPAVSEQPAVVCEGELIILSH